MSGERRQVMNAMQKTLILGVVVVATVLLPLNDANAWVAAGRGWGGG